MPEATDRIRHAIARGEFAGAEVLWEDLSRQMRERIASGAAGEAEREALVELYDWSRNVLLCERARILDRLNTLHAAGAYVGARF
jgi:hypothetical protein